MVRRTGEQHTSGVGKNANCDNAFSSSTISRILENLPTSPWLEIWPLDRQILPSAQQTWLHENVTMHTLSFTLGPEGVVRIHDAVLCLAKFSESVSLEAREDKVGIYSDAHLQHTYTN